MHLLFLTVTAANSLTRLRSRHELSQQVIKFRVGLYISYCMVINTRPIGFKKRLDLWREQFITDRFIQYK